MKKLWLIGLIVVLSSCQTRTADQDVPNTALEPEYTGNYTMPQEDLYRYNISVKAMGGSHRRYLNFPARSRISFEVSLTQHIQVFPSQK